ncbi:diguanylate cyclase domain-containing protein [Dactylosporangium sp. NPDC000521]|uniref:diguanylate cyclase domain-containing protein n=1 Tax=Dactylosporangium sp. NPDC000521 TaxID=3363975 RepID=UPI0036B9E182
MADVCVRMLDAPPDDGHLLERLVSAVGAGLPDCCVVGALTTGAAPVVRTAGEAGPALAGALLDAVAGTPRTDAENAISVVRILARGAVIGALGVLGTDGDPVPAADLAFVEAAATVAGGVIEHSHAFAATLELLEDARRQGDLLDAISDAIVSCDADGVIVSWNSGAERLYGYSSGDAVGCDLLALLATACVTDDTEVPAAQMLQDVAASGRWEGELRERRSDAAPLTVLSSVSALHASDDGTPAGYVFVNRDVTEQRRQEHEAAHDVLTGLPNRRRLVGRIRDAVERVRRGGGPMAVLFLDLNGFKPVNDKYGHAVGDELLIRIADRLAGTVRSTDFVARIGGDEFVVVLEQFGPVERVAPVLQRILAAVEEPLVLSLTTVTVSTSIGVAIAGDPEAAVDPEELVRAADEAMYRAKRRPRRVAFADAAMDHCWLALPADPDQDAGPAVD